MADNDTKDTDDPSDIQTLYTTLTTQAATLLSELTHFRTYLTNNPHLITRPDVLISKFQVDVTREVAYLARYGNINPSNTDPDTPTETDTGVANLSLDGIHRIRSSNITFLAGVWEALKGCRGVLGVRKTVRYVLPGSEVAVLAAGVANGADANVMEKRVSKKMSREARERAAAVRQAATMNGGGGMQVSSGSGSGSVHESTQSKQIAGGENSNATNKDFPENEVDGPSQPNDSEPKVNKTRGKLNSKGMVSRRDKEVVTVDIMADHGETWIKIFTKNQRWLMMDLAKEGFVDVGSDEEDGEDEDVGDDITSGRGVGGEEISMNGHLGQKAVPYNEDMEELKLVKMAREYLLAARTVRAGSGYRHPRVQFQMPRIARGVSRDVDRVLSYMSQIGVEVFTAEDLKDHGENGHRVNGAIENGASDAQDDASSLQKTFEQMICPPPPIPITDTLNVDCTILIALISDVSHARPSDILIPEHYKGSARRDIEVQLQTDIEDPLLPNHIYPILRGRRLVCTKKAAEHWRTIVRTMGSPSEALRSRILLGETSTGADVVSNREEFQRLSIHQLPDDLQIPFEVVDFDVDKMSVEDGNECKDTEIHVMKELVAEPRLSSLNCSVFFHGWYKNLTTVSLNRVVSEWLSRAISVVLDRLELKRGVSSDIAELTQFRGPNVLICGRERSLLGSEK